MAASENWITSISIIFDPRVGEGGSKSEGDDPPTTRYFVSFYSLYNYNTSIREYSYFYDKYTYGLELEKINRRTRSHAQSLH